MNYILMYFLFWALGMCMGALIVVSILLYDYDNILSAARAPVDDEMTEMYVDAITRGIESEDNNNGNV